MNVTRVGVLLGKELLQGPKSFIFIWALVAPVIISLVVSLAFGTLFNEKPTLGIADQGDSSLASMARDLDSIVTKEFATVPEIVQAAENGAIDMGLLLPAGFDRAMSNGTAAPITAYVWGESLAKHRVILGVALAELLRASTGVESPVEIESVTVGGGASVPWKDRLFPIIVLFAVLISGIMLSATSLVNEKEKRTLEALIVTPTSMAEVFAAKGLLGAILSLSMGIVILFLNQAFGAQGALMVIVIGLGAIMAAEFGLILGALTRDFTTLFAIWKMVGILFFAPGIVHLFPEIPEWAGRMFPTYYIVQPVIDMSQRGAGWAEVAIDVLVLAALDVLLVAVLAMVIARKRQFAS